MNWNFQENLLSPETITKELIALYGKFNHFNEGFNGLTLNELTMVVRLLVDYIREVARSSHKSTQQFVEQSCDLTRKVCCH
jgi:hypothetical protein